MTEVGTEESGFTTVVGGLKETETERPKMF